MIDKVRVIRLCRVVKNKRGCCLQNAEGSRLMRISLVRISLLRVFKTSQKYLAYAFLGLFISLLRFLYVLG